MTEECGIPSPFPLLTKGGPNHPLRETVLQLKTCFETDEPKIKCNLNFVTRFIMAFLNIQADYDQINLNG